MLEYRIRNTDFRKTRTTLPVNSVTFIDFNEILNEEDTDRDNVMVMCECNDIDRLRDGDVVHTVNTLILTFYQNDIMIPQTYTFRNDYVINAVNKEEKCFSFTIDKFNKLDVARLICGYQYFVPSNFFEGHDEDNIFMHCKSFHYFDTIDNVNEQGKQEIPIYFRYVNDEGENTTTVIHFRYYDYSTLTTSLNEFIEDKKEEKLKLFKRLFRGVEPTIEVEEEIDSVITTSTYYIVCPKEPAPDEEQAPHGWKIVRTKYNGYTYYRWQPKENDYDIYAAEEPQFILSGLGDMQIYRETFLFGQRTNYEFEFERPFVDINIPLVNGFDTNLLQNELVNEYFLEAEKKKLINTIVDVEKDVYYPCVKKIEQVNNKQKISFEDVYTIKFNLHFREHRTSDWSVENGSFWNGVDQEFRYINIDDETDVKTQQEYDALDDNSKLNYRRVTHNISINPNVTNVDGNSSDLLCFLNFNNDDVHYQKNKLKKSFLRLSFYDSMNPANQNLISYSTIFFDSGNAFSKYAKYIEESGYSLITYDRNDYGTYNATTNKIGIRVDRECNFNDDKRLSSQFVVGSKNTSTSSSDGFYLYVWKDNESTMPQDLFMKVEFNHAGFGRTIPFMMPFWDKHKWNDAKSGIKTFQEIINDWKDVKSVDGNGNVTWTNGTDGHYGIRQYNKYSYIHLKYQYDKENDKHYYYIDPDTYNVQQLENNNEIIINLYEAKIE